MSWLTLKNRTLFRRDFWCGVFLSPFFYYEVYEKYNSVLEIFVLNYAKRVGTFY